MNDIQRARDVLAKWRNEVQSPLPWRIEGQGNEERDVVDATGDSVVSLWSREEASSAHLYDGDDRLIVGTAGNPDLLDALDRMLERAAGQHERGYQGGWNDEMSHIAAAIIASDERMQQ